MNHFISLAQAVEMTTLYRQQKDNIVKPEFQGQNLLCISETFNAEPFKTVLNKPGCTGLRIYYGMGEDLKIHAIIVGVNDKDQDMLPATSVSNETNDAIIEAGVICPPMCPPPPPSPLND